ncbi:MAG: chromosome segregation ATPase [Synechococcaceae cyanobacterium RL_1_2]|nr:chromosome segregation ATPase [Synechococcaceae cyanobacterium RL_1_2]
MSSVVGYGATSWLLDPTKNSQCQIQKFFPSDSLQLYCAQQEAKQGTPASLLAAINIVNKIKPDSPLYGKAQDAMEEWAKEILDIGEKKFQAGELAEAIAIARTIPANSTTHSVVDEQIARWQSIWAEAEAIEQELDQVLRKSEWNNAFTLAIKLTNLDNYYLSTTKYEAAINKIQTARQQSESLDSAYSDFKSKSPGRIIDAIKKAQAIPKDSYAYQEAQTLIKDATKALVTIIDDYIERAKWSALDSLVNQLPSNLGLSSEVQDWTAFARAGTRAEEGTVSSLQSAIAEIELIGINRPLYGRAQELRERWMLEIEGVGYLTQAKEYAQQKSISSLRAAISQAQLIPSHNPVYGDAKALISSWETEIKTIEDRPTLNLAIEFAERGDIASLEQAIAQANLIGSSRPLYREAQRKVQSWRSMIEKIEDQPIFNQAIALAGNRSYQGAINTARQIARGRALYPEAQTKIREWQGEINAINNLNQAYNLANKGDTGSLARAIGLVNNISRSSSVYPQARRETERWGFEILSAAQRRQDVSIREAIALAKLVPAGNAAYGAAQTQISAWENLLKPPKPAVDFTQTTILDSSSSRDDQGNRNNNELNLDFSP